MSYGWVRDTPCILPTFVVVYGARDRDAPYAAKAPGKAPDACSYCDQAFI